MIVLTDKMLNVKDGTQRTLVRARKEDKTTVLTCDTFAIFPLDNCTIDCVVEEIVVNKCT